MSFMKSKVKTLKLHIIAAVRSIPKFDSIFLHFLLTYFGEFVINAYRKFKIRSELGIAAPNYFRYNTTSIMSVPERSSCVFCNIVNKLDGTEILYEDDEVCVFRDIKPASTYHVLTVPKRHIDDVKCLTAADKELVTKMLSVSKDLVTKNNLSLDDVRFGYHWPPFRSVHHLHLHTIAPESKMGFIARMIFKRDSYWFVSPEYVESRLQ